ncbi:transposase [Rhodococcus opacus]|nr:transposase [Rhodococcus opacus]
MAAAAARPTRPIRPRRCARASPRCGSARQPGHSPRRGRHSSEVWLLAEWPAGADEPTDYWLSTLPEDTPLPELVRLAKIRWRIEHDYRELKTGLGLDHFEGRSWLGWHHHATLVTAAHLFHHHPAAGRPKSDWAGLTLYGIRARTPTRTCPLDRYLPTVPPHLPDITKYY